MSTDPERYSVLFICTENSARSIMAEALLNELGGDRFRAYSAGSHPTGKLHPRAMAILKRQGLDTELLRSKSWLEFATPDAPVFDLIFTVCDRAVHEECPTLSGHPVKAKWSIPDPATIEGSDIDKNQAFADTYRMLRTRISHLLNLPLPSMDRMSLKLRLDEIQSSAVPDTQSE